MKEVAESPAVLFPFLKTAIPRVMIFLLINHRGAKPASRNKIIFACVSDGSGSPQRSEDYSGQRDGAIAFPICTGILRRHAQTFGCKRLRLGLAGLFFS